MDESIPHHHSRIEASFIDHSAWKTGKRMQGKEMNSITELNSINGFLTLLLDVVDEGKKRESEHFKGIFGSHCHTAYFE